MANEYFDLYSSPERYDEIYEKYLRISFVESKRLAEVKKTRIYLSVEEIDLIQDALQVMLQNVTDGMEEYSEHRVMQMGYSLEEVKHKLKRRS